MRILLVLGAVVVALACRSTARIADAEPSDVPRRLESAPPKMTFSREGENPVEIVVELADTDELRARGLMHRQQLDPKRGMLFVFPRDDDHTFWMKNTPLALDMIFLDSDWRVVGFLKRVQPFDKTPRGIGRPSRYVVEVNGAFADQHRIRIGSRVTLAPPLAPKRGAPSP